MQHKYLLYKVQCNCIIDIHWKQMISQNSITLVIIYCYTIHQGQVDLHLCGKILAPKYVNYFLKL